MNPADPTALSYLARRGVAPQWRGFLRALLETLDANLDQASRDNLLRSVGARVAQLSPLPPCGTMAELEARMNDALAASDWGYVELGLEPNERVVVLNHNAAPLVATAGDPSGAWFGAVLEGLYGTWLAAQPGAEPSLVPRRVAVAGATITLRYGR